ncbi:hypothetical protein TTHERM_01193530 (macronuclear) [Tetrahymena thermophila SB210]|uniref:Importin subunit alpha n=1 Tax=Tetrahymena thermophila (strain SB210) TaxID=312017 RepID=Q22AM3_TETTS|nr:hypothetical protein TTHERM_01193530 [Tetrahymena thermophila SB210]EAR82333.4 hypothetical protein TTHERM_01193530 [Tetrahymena thermophila SB210]|eukprot:XP_001029996.4 hypothetical protein TTHERM_01193530 [Tetrahymena thermophila SB210]
MSFAEEKELREVFSIKKEQFNVEIRKRKRNNQLERSRQRILSTSDKVEFFSTISTHFKQQSLEQQEDSIILTEQIENEEYQLIQNKFNQLQEYFETKKNNMDILLLVIDIKKMLKQGNKYISKCSNKNAAQVVSLFKQFCFSSQQLQDANQIQNILLNLSHILFQMSTTQDLPFAIIDEGQIELFESLLSHQNVQIVQTGTSILCNCVYSFPEQIKYIIESNLFYYFRIILLNKQSSFQIQFILLKLIGQYFIDVQNEQRQRDCIQLLFEWLPSVEKNQNDAELICIVCNNLCEYSILSLFLQEAASNSQFIAKLQKLIRFYKKKNKNVIQRVLEVLNEVLEKQFKAVSIYLESDLVKNLAVLCNSSDNYTSEKSYYILSNLVADSVDYAISISSNKKILKSLITNLQRCNLGIALEILYLIRNIILKIQLLEDIYSFINNCSLFQVFRLAFNNFYHGLEVQRPIIWSLLLLIQYSELDFEEQLTQFTITQIYKNNIFEVVQNCITSQDEQISQSSSQIVEKMQQFENRYLN